jgi:hypothetical protein
MSRKIFHTVITRRCKYLFLLYDDSFLRNQNYIFTTEGHPLPIRSTWHEKFPATHVLSNWTFVKVPFFFFLTYLRVFGLRNGVVHHPHSPGTFLFGLENGMG